MNLNETMKRPFVELSKPRNMTAIAISIMLGVTISIALKGRIKVNTSDSTSLTLFLVQDGEIRQGDYVVFTLEHPMLPKAYEVVKKVRCSAGHQLKVTETEAYCDGVFLGLKKKYSLKGEPMPKFEYNGVIPEGKLFVMNEHKDSFDSRYYGLRDLSEMTRVEPLF